MAMVLVACTAVSVGHLCGHKFSEDLSHIFASLILLLLGSYYLYKSKENYYSSKDKLSDISISMLESSQYEVTISWTDGLLKSLKTIFLYKSLSKFQVTVFALTLRYYSFDVLLGSIFGIIICGLFNIFSVQLFAKFKPWIVSLISGMLFFSYIVYDISHMLIE